MNEAERYRCLQLDTIVAFQTAIAMSSARWGLDLQSLWNIALNEVCSALHASPGPAKSAEWFFDQVDAVARREHSRSVGSIN